MAMPSANFIREWDRNPEVLDLYNSSRRNFPDVIDTDPGLRKQFDRDAVGVLSDQAKVLAATIGSAGAPAALVPQMLTGAASGALLGSVGEGTSRDIGVNAAVGAAVPAAFRALPYVWRAATSTKMRPGVVRVPRGMKRVTPEELAAADKVVMSPVSARDIKVAEAAARTIRRRAATSTKMRPGVVRVPRGMKRVTPEELAAADKVVMSPVSARDIEVAEAAARTIWNRDTGYSIYEFVDKNLSRIARAGEKAGEKAWDYTVGGAYEKGVEPSVKFLAKKLWPGGVTDSTLAGRPFGYATAVATGAGAVTGLKLGTDLIYDKWLEDGKKTGAGAKPGDGQAFVEQQETSRTPPSVQMDRRIARRVVEQAYSDYATNRIDSAEFDYRLAGVKANPELWSEFREREMGRRLSESGSAMTMRDLRRMAELGNDKAKAVLAWLEKWFDDTPTADLRKKGR